MLVPFERRMCRRNNKDLQYPHIQFFGISGCEYDDDDGDDVNCSIKIPASVEAPVCHSSVCCVLIFTKVYRAHHLTDTGHLTLWAFRAYIREADVNLPGDLMLSETQRSRQKSVLCSIQE